MIPTIKILFIGAPSKTTIQNQLLLLSNRLPLKGQFVENITEAISYLDDCSGMSFPDVLILDEDLGTSVIEHFLENYRRQFYISQMDSLLYISTTNFAEKENANFPPLVSGYLGKPLSKAVFLEEIYPLIAFTMV